MKKRNILVLMLLVTLSSFGFKIRSAVIYNKDSSYNGYPELADIFTGRKKYWLDGSRIEVFMKPVNSIEHRLFVAEWLKLSMPRYKRLLKESNKIALPKHINEVKTDAEMLAFISATPNSIGYVDNTLLIRSDVEVKAISPLEYSTN